MHPSCVNVLNIYTVLRNSQKTTRDFQRFRLRFWCRNGLFFFVSANFDIAASYIYSLGTVSVTVVTRILASASTESLSNSLSLLQFLLRLYSKLASSQWPSVTPDSLVSSSSRVSVLTPTNRVIVGHYFRHSKSHLIFRPVGRSIDWMLNYPTLLLQHIAVTDLYSFANQFQVSFFLTHL